MPGACACPSGLILDLVHLHEHLIDVSKRPAEAFRAEVFMMQSVHGFSLRTGRAGIRSTHASTKSSRPLWPAANSSDQP